MTLMVTGVSYSTNHEEHNPYTNWCQGKKKLKSRSNNIQFKSSNNNSLTII